MKKLLLGILLISSAFQTSAQEFNKWSIDVGAGAHRLIYPIASGYITDTPDFWQANLGVRYMVNNKFGLRLDFGYNQFSDNDNSSPFKTNYYRATLQSVVNAGNILNFKSWTKKINLLIHGGFGLSRLNPSEPVKRSRDQMTNFVVGITPQFKLSDNFALFLDVSSIGHFYQDLSFDGTTIVNRGGLNGGIINASVGLNIYLGKNGRHADWSSEDKSSEDNKIETLENRLKDAENEISVLKYANSNNNKGFDKGQLLSELDNRYEKLGNNTPNNTNVTAESLDFIKELIDNGYVNVYFDLNESNIQKGSISAINYLKQYMANNPSVKADLIGYADETGSESYNKNLSEKRAKKVYDVLVSAGVDANKLTYKGVGVDNTVSKNARQFARKVTFLLKK